MRITEADKKFLKAEIEVLKAPELDSPPAQRLPEVIETVSKMLSEIEKNGIDAVRKYSRDLDKWDEDFELSAADLAKTGDKLSPELRKALEIGSERTKMFAKETRKHLVDFELETTPGVVLGQKYIPIERVGAYLPAGNFPILSSAFMTVGVSKVAGVPMTMACTPPMSETGGNDAVLYSAYLSGVDRTFILGGVQALAAMTFGLLGEKPVDILVGAGNAYVAEAKRQLFGRVGIDLLAGPSEVAVIADDTADARMVACDLLGQAEHGMQSPASLVTTSRELGMAVIDEVKRQLGELSTEYIAGPAWRDYGTVYLVKTPDDAIEVMDTLAPEHLEILTGDNDYYLKHLKNYGSLFIGEWSTVSYADKGTTGTNHVLPTGGGAKYTSGLSVGRFLKPVTYQTSTRESTMQVAPHNSAIAGFEGMSAHKATADLRIELLNAGK